MATSAFEPQPLAAPLTNRALTSLADLATGDRLDKKLRDHFTAAIDQLTELTGRINDRAYERRVRHEREQARRRQQQQQQQEGEEDGGDTNLEEDAEAERLHQQFQQRVETLTKKMDLSIRAIIDDQTWLEDLPAALRHAVTAARNNACSSTQPQTQTQHTLQSPTPIQSTGDENDQQEGEDDPERKPPAHSSPVFGTPHALLSAALQERSRTWHSKTLTERYAHNNDYKGWYRVLYDAKHPGESAPPMPDERLWFAAEEGRELISTTYHHHHRPTSNTTTTATTTATHRQGHSDQQHHAAAEEEEEERDNDEDDEDIEIAAETLRIKCPITLLPYVDPVTSLKCSHSYEKFAIHSMLQTTQDHAPLTREQLAELDRLDRRSDRTRRERELRVSQVKCPECNVPLTAADLKPNPALKRRVQRLLERARRRDVDPDDDDEHEDEDDDVIPGTQRRPLGLGSSPVPPSSAAAAAATADRKSLRNVKSERQSSVIPQTQLSRPGMAQSGGTSPSRTRRGRGLGSTSRSAILDVEEDDLA